MIFTAMPSIGIRVNEAIAKALGIDVGIVYAIMISIIALTLTAAIMCEKSPKSKSYKQRDKD